MGTTTLYYFFGFIVFIVCLGGLQKWFKLPQPKKDHVGLIVLTTFLSSLLVFILLVTLIPDYLQAANVASIGILFVFLFIVFTAFFIKWYNDKYNKKLNISSIVLVVCLVIFAAAYIILKQMGTDDKATLVKNVQLKTVVTNITFDPHKPYFKDMTLGDGQFLPMPETMNNSLQIGDSIFKEIGESIFTVVNSKTKIKNYYRAAIHTRVFGKPQQK